MDNIESALLDSVEASVETTLNRSLSAIFVENNLTEKEKEKEKEKERLKKKAENTWPGKGLGVLPDGSIPKGKEGLLFAITEFFRGLLRGAGLGIIGKASLSFGFSAIKGNFFFKKALREAFGKDTRRFGLFLGAFIGIFRGTNAKLTSLNGEDKPLNSAIAGLVAGSALYFDEVARRQTLALYLFCRGLDVLTKRLVRDGVLPHYKWFEAFLFGLSNVPIMFGFLFMPEILVPSYYKWILNMGVVTDKGLESTLRTRRNLYFEKGEKIPFRKCSHGYHEGSCIYHCGIDWFAGLLRAAKIYLPVHIAPLLIFRYKTLFKKPKETLSRTLLGFASSCCFLTTYVLCVKGSQCFLRNLRQCDSGWHAVVAGMLTGLSTYFETKSRVSELMLYCLPRGMEAAWIYFEKQGLVKNIKNFEIVFFSLAMSMLCATSKLDYKGSYFSGLCFLLGSKN